MPRPDRRFAGAQNDSPSHVVQARKIGDQESAGNMPVSHSVINQALSAARIAADMVDQPAVGLAVWVAPEQTLLEPECAMSCSRSRAWLTMRACLLRNANRGELTAPEGPAGHRNLPPPTRPLSRARLLA